MKVVEEKIDVTRSADFKEGSFRIKPSRKAFAILSKGLYSNQIRAIVRELSTNAADAHIAAGNKEAQFKVHLPNRLEPYFSIRDFGTGLSTEDLETIYTTYFESTKTETDDQTGCLGLGSKSPFGYTDNFTVVDYFNGLKHTYTAFIAESGFPSIALMGTEETNEPNGLEVILAVKPEDFARFGEEAAFVYKYFKVRPIIGGQEVTFVEKKPSISGDTWRLYSGSGDHSVIMGNVRYPLNMYNTGCNHNVFTYYSIEIDVAIGEVEMTASRESLEYSEKTRAAIKQRVDQCIAVYADEIKAELAKQPTYWDACKFYSKNAIFLGYNTKWNDKPVGDRIPLGMYINCIEFRRNYDRVKMKLDRSISQLDTDDDFILVDNDLTRGARDRVKEYMKANDKKEAYLLTWDSPEHEQKFLDTLGTIPNGIYMKASSLPKIIRPKTTSSGPTPQAFTFNPQAEKKSYYWTLDEELDLEEGGVYIKLEHWSPVEGTNEGVASKLSMLKRLGHNIEVHGFRKKLWNKVERKEGWVNLDDYFNQVVAKFEADYDYAKNRYNYTSQSNLLSLEQYLSKFNIGDLFRRIEYCVQNTDRLDTLSHAMDTAKVEFETKTNVAGEVAELKKKYPLLFFITANCDDMDRLPADALQIYLDAADAALKQKCEAEVDNGLGI